MNTECNPRTLYCVLIESHCVTLMIVALSRGYCFAYWLAMGLQWLNRSPQNLGKLDCVRVLSYSSRVFVGRG